MKEFRSKPTERTYGTLKHTPPVSPLQRSLLDSCRISHRSPRQSAPCQVSGLVHSMALRLPRMGLGSGKSRLRYQFGGAIRLQNSGRWRRSDLIIATHLWMAHEAPLRRGGGSSGGANLPVIPSRNASQVFGVGLYGERHCQKFSGPANASQLYEPYDLGYRGATGAPNGLKASRLAWDRRG